MSSSVSKYRNVFNEPATVQNLSHIFDILDDKNDDRIIFRDFVMHMEHVGLKLDKKAQKKVYDHISSSVKRNRNITKESWIKGINIAHKQANTKKLYEYILSGNQYNTQAGREEIDMEEIRIKLKDMKAPWMYRIECMESLCRQITNKSLKTDKFHEKFRNYHIGLTVQARDRRSSVSRVACEVLAKIILRWKNDYLKYAYTTIEYIYELVRQKIQVVHESGYNVLTVLLKNCGDHKECKMLDILGREGTTSKFVNLQKDCFDLLHLYLTQQNENLKSKQKFWDKLLEYTQKGINDTADVRNSALKLLSQIQVERPQLVGNIINKMGVHLKKRYESEYMSSNTISNGDEKSNSDWGVTLDPVKIKSNKKDKNTKSPRGPKTPKSPKSPKKGGKSSASFPKPAKGEFLNGFGEPLSDIDMLFAFDFIDFKKDRKITFDEFEISCKRLNVNGKPNTLFNTLDDEKSESITLNTFKSAINKRNSILMDFWSKLLSGKHLEQTPLGGDIEFDEANKLLLNNKNSENDRLNAMYSITRKICNLKKWENQEKFDKQFKKSLGPLLNQLKDRNNSIVRQVCICLSKIFIVKKGMYRQFTIRTLENLAEVIKLQDEKIHMSSKYCVMTMIKYIPDRSACPMMKIICENCCAKNFVKLRSANFEYVNYYLFVMIKEFEEKKKIFWEFVEKALKGGLNDSDPGVRDLAYIALVKIEMLNKDLSEKYVSTLKKARKEKFNALKKDELKRIQKGEMYSVDGGNGNNNIESSNSESIKSPKSKTKNDKTHKINKRPKDDISDDEKKDERIKREKEKKEKLQKQKLAKEKAEKERLQKQKLAKEKEKKERIQREKLAKEKTEKDRLQKQKLAKEKEKREKLTKEKTEKDRLQKQKLQKEKERKEKIQKDKLAGEKAENDKLAREKTQKQRLQKEKLAREKAKKEKLAKEKAEKERLEKEKLAKEKNEYEEKNDNAQEERREKIRKMKEEERRDRLERQRKEKEKLEQDKKEEENNENKQKTAKEELEKKKAEREKLQQEKLAKQQKETRKKIQKLKEEQKLEKEEEKKKMAESGDFGFPKVHSAAKKYFEDKGVKCTNPTHLVLYAKKSGLDGVSFSNVSKYYKAQK